jgi:hypothetical protein
MVSSPLSLSEELAHVERGGECDSVFLLFSFHRLEIVDETQQ